jgi:hypothetical protein
MHDAPAPLIGMRRALLPQAAAAPAPRDTHTDPSSPSSESLSEAAAKGFCLEGSCKVSLGLASSRPDHRFRNPMPARHESARPPNVAHAPACWPGVGVGSQNRLFPHQLRQGGGQRRWQALKASSNAPGRDHRPPCLGVTMCDAWAGCPGGSAQALADASRLRGQCCCEPACRGWPHLRPALRAFRLLRAHRGGGQPLPAWLSGVQLGVAAVQRKCGRCFG